MGLDGQTDGHQNDFIRVSSFHSKHCINTLCVLKETVLRSKLINTRTNVVDRC